MTNSHHIENTILQLYAIAAADDNIEPAEMQFLYEYARSRGVADSRIDQVLLHTQDIPRYHDRSFDEKIELLFAAAGMMLSSGKPGEKEWHIYQSITRQLGFLEENTEAIATFMINEVRRQSSISEVRQHVSEWIEKQNEA